MVADLTKSKARAKDRAAKLPPATTMRLGTGQDAASSWKEDAEYRNLRRRGNLKGRNI